LLSASTTMVSPSVNSRCAFGWHCLSPIRRAERRLGV
jgi:hypothetical protein